MITAVDTSVLLDVFTADPKFGLASKASLKQCLAQGRVIVCAAVLAEVASAVAAADAARLAVERLAIDFEAMSAQAAWLAGEAFRRYRRRGGKRDRVIADFLIGAHARVHAERLLTRDRGFHRTYFEGLVVLDPSATS